ncbi:hypothetical protein LCGC14_0351590 [marine sediment metagenome]|uniref:Uncharacterized protein n=1 Tax=marine sediment metagenome TaxID=412755 RepID=A0A0F9TAS8_9ZZZZ
MKNRKKDKKKLSRVAGLQLIEDGVLTQEAFDAAVTDGFIAELRIPGGRTRFVSKEQEKFYTAKLAMITALKEGVNKIPAVKAFMDEYGSGWDIGGETVAVSVSFSLKNFQKCFNTFTPEEGEEDE